MFDVLPWQLSAPAVSFFQGQAGVAFDPSILHTAVAVVHVEAGMKIAELYSFLDQESGHHLGQCFPQYHGLGGLRRTRADDHRRVWPGLLSDVRRPW